MAQRRMFSDKIVDTDAFLDMGAGSQLLYFHLCMRADDDGFVSNPKKIMRMIGSQDDDYKVLLAKRFVIQFQSGVCVIKHWLIHNLIRQDRYNETQWVKEKEQLIIDEKTKKYSLNTEETIVIPNGNQMAPQVRLGKDSIGKDSIKNIYGEFENVSLTEEEHQKLLDKYGEKNTNILIEELSGYMASTKKKYASHYATILNWARRKIQTVQEKTLKNRFIA